MPNCGMAEAAARVAARYAKAPSYSEMQAAEARAALRAAEAATRAALEAQVAAQAALENLETTGEEREVKEGMHPRESIAVQEAERWQTWEDREASSAAQQEQLEVQWEPDLPAYRRASGQFEAAGDGRTSAAERRNYDDESQTVQPVEAAQPIPANLIEFPRELVATRRLRPRLTESRPGAAPEPYGQLSIFEVDPSTISTDPALPFEQAQMPSWGDHEWTAIELEERRSAEPGYHYEPAPVTHQAPFTRRLMATTVDVALILGLVCALAACLASTAHHLPGIRASELTALTVLMIVAVLYEGLFLLYAKCTPGMRYAQLSLCTFDDEFPTHEQMKSRMVAMLLSLLPMGLGMVWAIFDDDNMCWHDRHSRTYLRQG